MSKQKPIYEVVLIKLHAYTKVIPILNLIREVSGEGLKFAYNTAHNLPSTVAQGLTKSQAHAIVGKFLELQAVAVVRRTKL